MSEVDDMLEDFGAATLDEYFGESVVLIRGGVESAAFTATWSDVAYDVPDAHGFLTKVESRDFTFELAAAVISAAVVTPRAGDQIKFTENGTVKYFEAMPIGKEPATKELPGGFRRLLHTKRVE